MTKDDVAALLELRDAIAGFDRDELRVFSYVWDNISVGEILFERDLSRIHGVRKPILVAIRLRERGLIERGEGCYNLSRRYRRLRMKIGKFDELRRLLAAIPYA